MAMPPDEPFLIIENRSFYDFCRGLDSPDDNPQTGEFWPGFKKWVGKWWGAYARDDDASFIIMSPLTSKRLAVHECGHEGVFGASFPELRGEGRRRDGGLRHVPWYTLDVMTPYGPRWRDPRGLIAKYDVWLKQGRIQERDYEPGVSTKCAIMDAISNLVVRVVRWIRSLTE